MPETVLIIDDDAEFLANLSAALAEDGFRVVNAADGAEAVRRLDKDHASIDAVIVDLNLPNVSGFEIIGALSKRKNLMRVMATTGKYGESYLEVARYLGAHIAIRKPPATASFKEWAGIVRSLLKAEDDMGAASGSLE